MGGKLEGIRSSNGVAREHNDGRLDADERALLALLKEELIRPSPSLETVLRASIRRFERARPSVAAKKVRRRAA
jgi:hypothetical protein